LRSSETVDWWFDLIGGLNKLGRSFFFISSTSGGRSVGIVRSRTKSDGVFGAVLRVHFLRDEAEKLLLVFSESIAFSTLLLAEVPCDVRSEGKKFSSRVLFFNGLLV
jgi:hypothetical protein